MSLYNRKTILFFSVNGVGLGHLTRLLAIARRMKGLQANVEIIFFSLSSAIPLISREGFLGYHLPSIRSFSKSEREWNQLLTSHLDQVISLHRPEILVFDGVFLYKGLQDSIQNQTGMKRIWIYRELRKNNKTQFMNTQHFDQVIIPTEAGNSFQVNHPANVCYCAPIIYLDKSELLPKEDIRKQWRIPDHCKLVYVQLGSGQLNDVQSPLSMLQSILRQRQDLFMVVGEHILGEGITVKDDRMMVLRDYPNSKYFQAFDLAISASGYNTYHELMYFQVPTIFIPNEKSTTDDQLSRANNAQKYGAALVLQNPTEDKLRAAMDDALDEGANGQLRLSAQKLVRNTGALQAAKLILGD